MNRHRLALAVAAIGLAGMLVGEAHADGFRGGFGIGAPRAFYGQSQFGFGRSPSSLYGLGRMFVPPHFAIHPPVYYSLPQPRPYGHSPFAASGDYHPPRPAPRIVRNPHVELLPTPAADESVPEATTSTARLILNPYFDAAESRLAAQTE